MAQRQLLLSDSVVIAGRPFDAVFRFPSGPLPLNDSSRLGDLAILQMGELRAAKDGLAEIPLKLVALDTGRISWNPAEQGAYVMVRPVERDDLQYGPIRYLFDNADGFTLPWWAYIILALLLLGLFFYLRRRRAPQLLKEETLGDREKWMKAAKELKAQKNSGQLRPAMAAENSMILLRSLLRLQGVHTRDKTGMELLKLAKASWPDQQDRFATVVNYCYRVLYSGADPGTEAMGAAVDQLPPLGENIFARNTESA